MPLPRRHRGPEHGTSLSSSLTSPQIPTNTSTKNGGYINPPPEKRQFRDPYADWWDKQERRNYGEPVHEDNDILGMFSPEEYTHFKPAKGFFLLGCFVTTVVGLCVAIYPIYPDKPSAPRTFPGGLDRELGGPGAVHVSHFLARRLYLECLTLVYRLRRMKVDGRRGVGWLLVHAASVILESACHHSFCAE